LVCFADGCADPTRDLAVEITGGTTNGLFAQDFDVPQLGQTQDFSIPGPLTIGGSFQRERTAAIDPTQRSIYTDEVLVRATGESEILPGIARSFQARFSMTDRGTFSMNVGQGRFTVTAFPTDPEVPPQTFAGISANRDAGATVNFAFPSLEGSITLSGRLIRSRVASTPPTETYLTQSPLDLQAFDPRTSEPLSQRIETSTGRPGARGDFILVMSPKAATLAQVELVASPRESGTSVPTKRFTITPPYAANLTLELGEYGEPIPEVPGQVLGFDGQPLAMATVVVEGRVNGGGQFRSRIAQTDGEGRFSLELLPTTNASLVLTVFPRAGDRSAITQVPIQVNGTPGMKASIAPSVVRCFERTIVSGTITTPEGMPASQVTVRAVDVSSTSRRPLPLDDVEATTSGDGAYSLFLDSGDWRLEFVPAPSLAGTPQTSRLITVAPLTMSADGGLFSMQTITSISLPKGRRVTGTITSTFSNRGATPLTSATIRFFRVTRVDGKPISVLLATGVTDAAGSYTVILPTRDVQRAP
jgi:hypothetical protein